MHLRIFQPPKNAMQSGRAHTRKWVVESEPVRRQEADPLMGWIGGGDTVEQIHLTFDSREEAVAYAERNGHDYTIIPARQRKMQIKNYADNFRFDRVR